MDSTNYRKISSLWRVFGYYLYAADKISDKLYEEKAIPLSTEELRVSLREKDLNTRIDFVWALLKVIHSQNDRTYQLFKEALQEFEPNWSYIFDLSPEELKEECQRIRDR